MLMLMSVPVLMLWDDFVVVYGVSLVFWISGVVRSSAVLRDELMLRSSDDTRTIVAL